MNGRTGRGTPASFGSRFRRALQLAGLAALLVPAVGAALADEEPEIVAVCVTNSLEEPITYEYRWGTGEWSWDRLEVGEEVEHRLEVDPREGKPWLQVRFRRSFGERDMRTVLHATPVKRDLECEPMFATPSAEELAERREEMQRTAQDRWHDAARDAEQELTSALDLYFDVTRKDRAIVRVWKLGEPRPVVLGRISELREAARPEPVSLWGEGRYLVEIFEDVELEKVDSFVLEAKDLPELTRLRPHLGPR